MATLPGGALPLPVPAPAPAKLATLFADASMDPTDGDCAPLMSAFLHDLNNAHINTATEALRDMVTASGARNELLSFTIVHGNRARLYTLCKKWQDGLTGRNPALNGKFFALEGELIQDRGHIVELDAAVFNLPGTVTIVPNVTTITDALTAAPDLDTMAGPYTAGDPGVEGVKTRKICPVPHSLAGLWLLHEDGITWQYYFGTVYPAIVAEGNEATYTSLTQFMQQLSVGIPSSINVTTRPAAATRSAVLSAHYMDTLGRLFPQLRPDATAMQHNQIAGALGLMAAQQQAQYSETKLAKETKAASTVESWLGEDDFPALLNLTNTRNEGDLIAACPVYKAMAAASKSMKMTRLQSAINKVRHARDLEDLVVIITLPMFNLFSSMDWHRTSPSSLASGFFSNPFIWGACDEEARTALNLRARLVHGGDTAASDADVQAMLKLEINPPLEDESIDNFKRMEIVASVLLPEGHGFLVHLREHIRGFKNFERKWKALEMTNPNFQGAKGVFHAQFMGLRFDQYWKKQKNSSSRIPLDDPKELINLIELSKAWEPALPATLMSALKLNTLGRVGQVKAPALDDDVMTQATALSTRSALTGLSIGGMTGQDIKTLLGTVVDDASTKKNGEGTENPDFHHVLFGEIKARTVGGKTIKSRDVRDKIKRGDLPALPLSKADGKAMCLAWHTKGLCNPECPRAADHVVYSAEEYTPLCAWCTANYPKAE